jgi:hypothetical protein
LTPASAGDCIALGGKIAVCAIGGGTIEPGETDWGIVVIAPGSGGIPPAPCDEHAVAKSAKKIGANTRFRRLTMAVLLGKRLECFDAARRLA